MIIVQAEHTSSKLLYWENLKRNLYQIKESTKLLEFFTKVCGSYITYYLKSSLQKNYLIVILTMQKQYIHVNTIK